jgi:hypothetical protein
MATSIGGRWLGLRLVRKNRRLVLFLRRFGNTGATKTVRDAALDIGRSWRLVTLDDQEVDPLGVGSTLTVRDSLTGYTERAKRWFRILRRVLVVVGVLATVGAVACGAVEFLFTSGDAQHRLDMVVLSVDGTVEGGPGASGLRFFAAAVLGCIAITGIGLLIAMAGVVLIPAASALENVSRGIDSAEESKQLVVADKAEADSVKRRIAAVARQVFAPRLVVVKVASGMVTLKSGALELWQYSVIGLATSASIVLVDISMPSQNVLWEVEALAVILNTRCLFVGEEARLEYLHRPGPVESSIERLRDILDGRTVLAYSREAPDPGQFARTLRAALEHELRVSR